jgi:hypothetical protein
MRGEDVMRGEESLKLVISGSRYTLKYGGEQLSGKVEFRLGLDEGERILAFYPEAGRFSDSSKIRIEQQMRRIGADPFFVSDFENLHTPFNYEVVQQWNHVYIFMDYDGTHFRKPC